MRNILPLFVCSLELVILAGCSRKGDNAGQAVRLSEEATYVGGTPEDARNVQSALEDLSANVNRSPEAIVESIGDQQSLLGEDSRHVVQKYLFPSRSDLTVDRQFKVVSTEGVLEGDEAVLKVTVDGKFHAEGKDRGEDRTADIVETGAYAYVFRREGDGWRVAGIRPLDVTRSYGEGRKSLGILAEARINGRPISPDGAPLTLRRGDKIDVECRFLGDVGERMVLSGSPLSARSLHALEVVNAEAQTYRMETSLRSDLPEGDYFLEISTTDGPTDRQATFNRLFSLPLRIEK